MFLVKTARPTIVVLTNKCILANQVRLPCKTSPGFAKYGS